MGWEVRKMVMSERRCAKVRAEMEVSRCRTWMEVNGAGITGSSMSFRSRKAPHRNTVS